MLQKKRRGRGFAVKSNWYYVTVIVLVSTILAYSRDRSAVDRNITTFEVCHKLEYLQNFNILILQEAFTDQKWA